MSFEAKHHIDVLTANFVLHPDRFDVVVASNLFGDILSDLGPSLTPDVGGSATTQASGGGCARASTETRCRQTGRSIRGAFTIREKVHFNS
jgi:isocitrate/isopropylmalate dehydrogenase